MCVCVGTLGKRKQGRNCGKNTRGKTRNILFPPPAAPDFHQGGALEIP